MLERHDAESGRHYRASHACLNPLRPDGTILAFSGGNLALRSNEWFTIQQVEEVLMAFLEGRELPEFVVWRDISAMLDGGITA